MKTPRRSRLLEHASDCCLLGKTYASFMSHQSAEVGQTSAGPRVFAKSAVYSQFGDRCLVADSNLKSADATAELRGHSLRYPSPRSF